MTNWDSSSMVTQRPLVAHPMNRIRFVQLWLFPCDFRCAPFLVSSPAPVTQTSPSTLPSGELPAVVQITICSHNAVHSNGTLGDFTFCLSMMFTHVQVQGRQGQLLLEHRRPTDLQLQTARGLQHCTEIHGIHRAGVQKTGERASRIHRWSLN